MIIFSIIDKTKRLNDRMLLIEFIDKSTMMVDGYGGCVDIININGDDDSWAKKTHILDIEYYWDLLWNMAENK